MDCEYLGETIRKRDIGTVLTGQNWTSHELLFNFCKVSASRNNIIDVMFVASLLWTKRFFSGYSGFPSLQFDLICLKCYFQLRGSCVVLRGRRKREGNQHEGIRTRECEIYTLFFLARPSCFFPSSSISFLLDVGKPPSRALSSNIYSQYFLQIFMTETRMRKMIYPPQRCRRLLQEQLKWWSYYQVITWHSERNWKTCKARWITCKW